MSFADYPITVFLSFLQQAKQLLHAFPLDTKMNDGCKYRFPSVMVNKFNWVVGVCSVSLAALPFTLTDRADQTACLFSSFLAKPEETASSTRIQNYWTDVSISVFVQMCVLRIYIAFRVCNCPHRDRGSHVDQRLPFCASIVDVFTGCWH